MCWRKSPKAKATSHAAQVNAEQARQARQALAQIHQAVSVITDMNDLPSAQQGLIQRFKA